MTTRCQVLILAALALAVAGCGGGSGDLGSVAPSSRFEPESNHPYLPLWPGMLWIYEGEDEGRHRQEVVRTLEDPQVIANVLCTAVVQEVYLEGVLVEVTTEWYAQDGAGDVWKFGEETLEDHGGGLALMEDSWIVGNGAAWPWRALSADPFVGETYAGYRPGGQDEYRVLSVTETVTVPAGTYEDCLMVMENPDDVEDQDIVLYARGVGRVSEESTGGHLELVSVEGN